VAGFRWIVVVALLLAFLSKYIIGAIVKPFTQKTKTIIDDLIIEAINAPIFAAIIAGGLWIGINRILTVARTESIVNKIFIIVIIGIIGLAISRIVHALLEWYSVEIAPELPVILMTAWCRCSAGWQTSSFTVLPF